MLCKVRKNIIFQNKTFLVMFYKQNKTFWYQFCNFKHFLKAENSEDSLASSCAAHCRVDMYLFQRGTIGPMQADCNGTDNELSEQSYVQSRSMRDRPVRHFARCYSLGFWAKFQIQYKMPTTDTYHEGRTYEFYCQFKFSAQGQVYKLLALACLTSFPELKVAW